ncbi:MAG TPA: hypothetical protein VE422_31660 [Terriglobia bacterium]|nr:hypothetical protein [Terriglobia bacterium]
MKNYRVFLGLFVALLFALSGPAAMAQSTIFNIPSTDTVAKAKGYVEFDFLPQMPTADGANRLYIYNPRVVAGVGGNVEIGANFATYHTTGVTNAYFQPNIKWKFFNNDDKGLAASGGAIMFTPLNHREGVDTYGMVYGNFSKKVKSGNYGPRVTAGPYGIVSGGSDFIGPKSGVILGYEQPVASKASIVADWFSGKNGFGYFTPGVSFTLPANGLLNIGYSIGNDSWADSNATKNRFLFVYYGVTF